jgi:hypothetical protein
MWCVSKVETTANNIKTIQDRHAINRKLNKLELISSGENKKETPREFMLNELDVKHHIVLVNFHTFGHLGEKFPLS